MNIVKTTMDDDFELVPKSLIKELKEENKELKEQLEKAKNNSLDVKLVGSLKQLLEVEFKKERDSLIAHIVETKELSKSTLNNLVTKTESLDHKLEGLVDGLEDLLKSLGEIISEVGSFKNSVEGEQLETLGKKIDLVNYHLEAAEHQDIHGKLQEIEEFMNNLKILLAQIKSPQDFPK